MWQRRVPRGAPHHTQMQQVQEGIRLQPRVPKIRLEDSQEKLQGGHLEMSKNLTLAKKSEFHNTYLFNKRRSNISNIPDMILSYPVTEP